MSKFEVTQAEINSAIQELTSQNAEFKTSITQLVNAQQELAGMWQGDANTAFNNAFNSDKGQWDTFAGLITTYIEGLSRIMTLYANAEAENQSTATQRTY